MAVIHLARDTATGREVALKRLTVARDDSRYGAAAELFEREFYTLAELSHPRVVEVFFSIPDRVWLDLHEKIGDPFRLTQLEHV